MSLLRVLVGVLSYCGSYSLNGVHAMSSVKIVNLCKTNIFVDQSDRLATRATRSG